MTSARVAGAEPNFECVSPLGRLASTQISPASRIHDLSGITIAELWNFLFQGETMFPAIRAELSKRFPGIRFVGYDTFGSTNGPLRNDILARLPQTLREQGVDAVISGVGA